MDLLVEATSLSYFYIGEFYSGGTVCGKSARTDLWGSGEATNRSTRKFISIVSILPIYDSILTYGKEKARLRKSGTMISDFDLLIGCTAAEKELIMATENVREFERISNIVIENWVDRNN